MKLNIDIDLTPEEARKVMGLPDIEPMQQEMLAKIKEKMFASLDEMSEPDMLMKRFMPAGIQGMEQFQKFMAGFAKASSPAKEPASEKSKDDTKKKD